MPAVAAANEPPEYQTRLVDSAMREPQYKFDLCQFAQEVIPWKEPGAFERWKEPWPWQTDLLRSIGDEMREKDWGAVDADGMVIPQKPIQRVICSCTGSGKTAFTLPIVLLHLLAVQPTVKVICLSPSREQIKDKLAGATKSMIASSPMLTDLFTFAESGKVKHRLDPDNTFAVFRTAGQVESLQGTHSNSGIVAVIVDEASGVPDDLWNATFGARQDPCCLVLLAGNPLRSEGFYWERHSGPLSNSWKPVHIAANTLPTWDESKHPEIIEEAGGTDTTTYRAAVLGLPPLDGEGSFVPVHLVEEAMNLPLVDDGGRPLVPADTPVVAGVDLARGGENNNCAVFRAGVDARMEVLRRPGRELPPKEKIAWLVEIATQPRGDYGAPAVVYVDATGLDGQMLWDLERVGQGAKFVPVNFGGRDPSGKCRNLRASMWSHLRTWLYRKGRLRSDRGLLNAITAARADYTKDNLQITPKDEIAAKVGAAGKHYLDEIDALLLSMLAPPSDRYSTPHGFPNVRRSDPLGRLGRSDGRSWMG